MNFLFFGRKYKFTDKKHSKRGLISSGLFLCSLAALIIGIYISYNNKGSGAMLVGVLGLLSFFISSIGFLVGIRSFKEEGVFLLYPWIGTVGNAVVWIMVGIIILIGI